MKPGAAVSRSGSAVAFSWEQEPGVSKQSPVEANSKPTAREAGSERTSAKTDKKKKPAAETTAHPHRLRVPPPPGGFGAPAASPPSGRSRPRGRSVRAGDDPFLAAYLACTGGRNGSQKLLGWAGLRFGYGLGLSCKSTCEAVQDSMVRRAKIPPPNFARK